MASALRRWLPIDRLSWRRASRILELVLCAVLVFGLFPGSAEVVETVAHVVHDGHLPHSEAHDDVAATEDCDAADEHGCTPLQHQCKCCSSASALPPTSALAYVRRAERVLHVSISDRGPPHLGTKPGLPPPIT